MVLEILKHPDTAKDFYLHALYVFRKGNVQLLETVTLTILPAAEPAALVIVQGSWYSKTQKVKTEACPQNLVDRVTLILELGMPKGKCVSG